MLRGEIWFGVWPNDPFQKQRPLLIVSNNQRNSQVHILDVIVVKLTSLQRIDGSLKPVNTVEDLVIQLKKQSIVRCGSIYSVEKAFLKTKATRLTSEQMQEVDERLKTALDLHTSRLV